MGTAHIYETMHGVVSALHEETHISEIKRVQDGRLSLGRDWRTRDVPSYGGGRISRIAGAVASRTCPREIESIVPPRGSRLLPRRTDRLARGAAIPHEILRDEVQGSRRTAAQVSIRNGSLVL